MCLWVSDLFQRTSCISHRLLIVVTVIRSSRAYDALLPCRLSYPKLYARHTSGRGVATDRGPVTNARIVAYALCSKNVVRVNEAKLHTEVPCIKDILSLTWLYSHSKPLLHLLPPLFPLVLQSIAPNYSPKATLAFFIYIRIYEEFLKSTNNIKI